MKQLFRLGDRMIKVLSLPNVAHVLPLGEQKRISCLGPCIEGGFRWPSANANRKSGGGLGRSLRAEKRNTTSCVWRVNGIGGVPQQLHIRCLGSARKSAAASISLGDKH